MESAGHLRRLTPLVFCFALGCTYAGNRARDFSDIFRIEGNAGLGLRANVTAGELVHAGVGSSRHHSVGLVYGVAESRWQIEDHFPLSYVYTLIEPESENLHEIDLGTPQNLARHRCYMLFPGGLHGGELYKSPIHYFDIEVGVLAGVLGIEVGFSIGEFFDWLLGFFTLDIADDDSPEVRKDRSLWNKPTRKEPLIPR